MRKLKFGLLVLGIGLIQVVSAATVSVPAMAHGPASVSVATPSSVSSPAPADGIRDISLLRASAPPVADDSSIANIVNQYGLTHPGTYKVSVTELSGVDGHQAVDGDVPVTAASTYKLFVAYSTILAIEAGDWSWSDLTTTGQDVSTCFDLMIEDSDNDCAIALLEHLGNSVIQGDAEDEGALHTVFLDDDITSTADDESMLLSKLGSGALSLSDADSHKWILAMQANEYRDGIPTGLPNLVVADKVGFLDDLLHDAAIVYSPKGAYALVILTEGSSWANIAELASQIEASR